MELKQLSKWMVISGTLLIWLIKYLIRPVYFFEEPVRYFLNIAPNLIGSFLIPFGAYWFFSGKNFIVARVFRIHSANDLRLVCIMGFVMLVVNEYLQRIPFFGRTFDINDILFSAAGLAIAYFVFHKIWQRRRHHSISF